jgi:hypothetical protein
MKLADPEKWEGVELPSLADLALDIDEAYSIHGEGWAESIKAIIITKELSRVGSLTQTKPAEGPVSPQVAKGIDAGVVEKKTGKAKKKSIPPCPTPRPLSKQKPVSTIENLNGEEGNLSRQKPEPLLKQKRPDLAEEEGEEDEVEEVEVVVAADQGGKGALQKKPNSATSGSVAAEVPERTKCSMSAIQLPSERCLSARTN